MRSTIKSLPATLPEPSSMDRGPRTGVIGAVSYSASRLTEAFAAYRASKSINQRLEYYWLGYSDEKSAVYGKRFILVSHLGGIYQDRTCHLYGQKSYKCSA